MHFYLFDSFLADPKYKKILEEIENRILDLDIGGRSIHLTVLRDFAESLKTGLQDKYTTVVIVGDDRTLQKALPIIASTGMPLGIIPVGEEFEICQQLGLPRDVDAVDIVANRLLEKIDLATANSKHFISKLDGKNEDFIINFDDQFDLEIFSKQNLKICNLTNFEAKPCDPKDNLLDVIVYDSKKSFFSKPKIKFDTHLQAKKIIIRSRSKSAPISVDNHQVIKTPVKVEILPQSLSIIVGRKRKF